MGNYDINIMKNNIRKIMKEKNITQTKLSEETGIQQPTISEVLSCKNSHSFTISQLADIAKVLQTSTDDILGISPTHVPDKEKTLSDIFSKLFEINKILNVNIGTCETGKYELADEFTGESIEVKTTGIFFDNDIVSNILKEWGELKSVNASNISTKQKIMKLWESNILSDSRERKSIWQFKNKKEYVLYLANDLIERYPFGPSTVFPYTVEDEVLLNEYIDSGRFLLDFDTLDQEILPKAFDIYLGISAEEVLPFN